MRYSERAYRYVLLDAGHVCQNLYLAAESIQCGVCGMLPMMTICSMQPWVWMGKKN